MGKLRFGICILACKAFLFQLLIVLFGEAADNGYEN